MSSLSLFRSLWGIDSTITDDDHDLFTTYASHGFTGFEGSLQDIGIKGLHHVMTIDDTTIPTTNNNNNTISIHHPTTSTFFSLLNSHSLSWICGIYTSWSNYLPCNAKEIPISCHVMNLKLELTTLQSIVNHYKNPPVLINCHLGSDTFSVEQGVQLLTQVYDMIVSESESFSSSSSSNDDDNDSVNLFSCILNNTIPFCFETHRGRLFYSPWQTCHILKALPRHVLEFVKLTLDLSHWVIVSERTLSFLLQPSSSPPSHPNDTQGHLNNNINDDDDDDGYLILSRVWHIHARVGTSQASQVHDPSLTYKNGLTRDWESEYVTYFQSVWKRVIQLRRRSLDHPQTSSFSLSSSSSLKKKEKNGILFPTVTPEYGPPEDLYMPRAFFLNKSEHDTLESDETRRPQAQGLWNLNELILNEGKRLPSVLL